jgi:ribonuclease HI
LSRELDLPAAEVLRRFHDGPLTGVFTDGAAHPNPGPGGWGAVYVVDDKIVSERFDHEPHTTNNRMELMALRVGLDLVPKGTSATVYTDSELCVKTFTQWVARWEASGWKRKGGPIKNLALVQQIYECLRGRPELRLQWIAAHNGYRWNEYADSLATAYRRIEK